MAEQCSACRFWIEDGPDDERGECRKHAPHPLVSLKEWAVSPKACWPITFPSDWCGEYQTATVAERDIFDPEVAMPKIAARRTLRLIKLVNLKAPQQVIDNEVRLLESALGGRHWKEPDDPQPATVAPPPPAGG